MAVVAAEIARQELRVGIQILAGANREALGAAVEAGGGSRDGKDAAAATTHVAAAPEAVGSETVSSEVEDAD